PKANARITTMVKPGVCRNMWAECLRSLRKPCIAQLDEKIPHSVPRTTIRSTGRFTRRLSLGPPIQFRGRGLPQLELSRLYAEVFRRGVNRPPDEALGSWDLVSDAGVYDLEVRRCRFTIALMAAPHRSNPRDGQQSGTQ